MSPGDAPFRGAARPRGAALVPPGEGADGPVRADGLRLALFTDTFAPQLNGVTRTLERLVHAIRERGGEVVVVTTTAPSEAERAGAPEAAAEIERWPSVPFWGYRELRVAPPARRRAERVLRRFRPTLVHAATPFGVGIAGRAAALALGAPLVTSYHTSFSAYARFYGLRVLTEPAWRFLRWFHNGGRRTYCPTRAVCRELTSRGFTGTAVWGRGVDAERFHPKHRSAELRARLGADEDTVVVAYVGRIAREKGLDTALDAVRAARQLARRRVVFALAGDGPYEAACRRNAPPGTVFAGRLVGDALAAFYASADLFVFPSVTDTFGNVLLEAMASGLAVVAADAPPTRELLGVSGPLAAGGRGEVTPAASPLLMGNRIARLVDEPTERARLAARGRAYARTRSWDLVTDDLLRDYADACAPRSRPA